MPVKKTKSVKPPVGIGVIGLGHWGPNFLRVMKMIPEVSVVAAADPDRARVRAQQELYPAVRYSGDYRKVLDDKEVQAVVVATPSSLHHQVVTDALDAGKDVLCEKPLALTSADCQDLIRMASRKKRILMVAHVFMYNPGVLKIKEYMEDKSLGDVYYLTSVRTNLGPVREDINVVFDLAAHDVSIFNFILNSQPSKVTASGSCFIRKDREDFCFATLQYPKGVLGHIHLSWLTPRKQREILVVGSRRMIAWNDLDPLEPVKVYQRGSIKEPFYTDYGAFQRMARASDVHLPAISHEEPLLLESRHFIDCVINRSQPLSDGKNGLQVIQVLEQIQKALEETR